MFTKVALLASDRTMKNEKTSVPVRWTIGKCARHRRLNRDRLLVPAKHVASMEKTRPSLALCPLNAVRRHHHRVIEERWTRRLSSHSHIDTAADTLIIKEIEIVIMSGGEESITRNQLTAFMTRLQAIPIPWTRLPLVNAIRLNQRARGHRAAPLRP